MSNTSNFGVPIGPDAHSYLKARATTRRRLQYSLGARLLLLALVAMLYSWVDDKRNELRREREAVAEIGKLGGIVRWDWQYTKDRYPQPPGPAWVKRLLGDNCFATVESVDATKQFGDEGLKHLKDLRELHILRLSESAVTNDGLTELKSVKGLRTLLLGRTQISDAGLKHVEGMSQLEELYLDQTGVTDDGLKHLKGLKNLTILSLDDTQITDAGLDELQKLPSLDTVCLLRTKVTRQGQNKFKQALPRHRDAR